MTTNLVLTIIADDRPGLVDSLAEVVSTHSGNWLDSSMSQLAGKFAGILRVAVADDCAEQLVAALNDLPDEMHIHVERVTPPVTAGAPRTFQLSLVGNDRPGIVREISRALHELGVNVEQLNTECVPAPMSSEELFKAEATLKVPPELDVAALQQRLETLADDLIVDINLRDSR